MPRGDGERRGSPPLRTTPDIVRRLLFALVTALSLSALAAPTAGAAATFPQVGFGEQRPEMFSNRHWSELGLPDARLLVGWDALQSRWQRREIDIWISEAERVGARVLVAFSRSRTYSRRKLLPTPRQYRAAFRAFRKRYPSVRQFLVWNEANHCSQPLCHKPRLAARYFDVMSRVCGKCTIVAADVLDTPDMEWWLREFRRAAKKKPRIWGLHNYLDANRFRTSGTRAMLRAVKGDIWFTETGGLVRRDNGSALRFPESPSHAARATRWLFKRLVPLSPRIRRVYLYHWQNAGPEATWDSAILDPKGRPRPAYGVLASYVARIAHARQAR